MGEAIPASKGIGYLNHPYNYVDGNPVNRTDRTGEFGLPEVVIIGGAVLAGVMLWNGVENIICECNKKYPDHADGEEYPGQRKGYLQCIAGWFGILGTTVGGVAEPDSTSAQTPGELRKNDENK
jgi:hypothetical protein